MNIAIIGSRTGFSRDFVINTLQNRFNITEIDTIISGEQEA